MKKPSDDDRLRLAQAIASLSSGALSIKKNQKYLALQIGPPPYCNAVSLSLHKDRVSFYIPSTQLMKDAIDAGFGPEPAKMKTELAGCKYFFNGLKLSDLEKHEAMFRAIVKESVDFIISRRPKGK